MRPSLPVALAATLFVAGCDNTSSTVSMCTTASNTVLSTEASADVAAVVAKAQAFYATLSSSQQTTVQVALSSTNAVKWSNLPVGAATRNGIRMDALTTAQQTAAKELFAAALSAQGYSTFDAIRYADEYIRTVGGNNGYNYNYYYVAFLGTPSTSSPWILQFGGHHYAMNYAYNGTKGTANTVTPMHVASEPTSFTYSGTAYAPMETRRSTMANLFNSLTTSQLTTAKLSTSFSDVLVGPGKDGQFPTQQGLPYASLTSDQQALFLAAVNAWLNEIPDADAAVLRSAYLSTDALASTYVAYSSTTNLTTQGSYVRLDGPRLWMEIATQGGIVFSGTHYHMIWRDKTMDYGANFSTLVGTEEEETPNC